MKAEKSILPPQWWQFVSAMGRPYLKAKGITLRDLIDQLDEFKERGFDALEVFAPCKGGKNYFGLDTLDYYVIDPEIGTIVDFQALVEEAHHRGIAIILFINLGYSHESFPPFLKACDDIRNGIDSPETRFFLWSDTGKVTMDRGLAPHFMNDSHGEWRWNEHAQKFFWVKWFGEDGQSELPQFNFGDAGWQVETQHIVDFWMQTGIDGMVIDAVNWYIGCNWEICRKTMTDVIHAYPNQFSQPEGAGGFGDDPVLWISEGGFNCVMDYAIKLWWENQDTIGDAIRSGDPRPIEAALRSYRDRVVSVGGVCYIDPPNLDDMPLETQVLGAAVVATIGELVIFIGDKINQGSKEYWHEITKLLNARRKFPALCAGGERIQISTQDDSKFYAFLRIFDGASTMLVLLNFQPDPAKIQIDFSSLAVNAGCNIWTGEIFELRGKHVGFELPAYGYSILEIVDDPTSR
jgi:glycosidase